jgi:hypothetical protein
MESLQAALEKAFSKMRRKRVSRKIFQHNRGIVQRGIFKGLVLDGRSNISQGPLGLKIYGLFEQEVVKKIEQLAPYSDVVNIGAADGYFSLGMVKSGLAKRSICFEITKEGREAIVRNASINQVENKVVIFGQADQNIGTFLQQAEFDPVNSLVLCDIEGGEFDLFTRDFFEAINGASIIIELHDRIFLDSLEPREKIINNIPAGYRHQVIRSKPPEWSGIEEIEALSDNDRALVTSEGRNLIGEWLVITPGSTA